MSQHTYECTISSIPLTLLSLLGNVFFTFFPCAHPLQTPSCFAWIYESVETSLLVVLCNAHVQAFGAIVHLVLLTHETMYVQDFPLVCTSFHLVLQLMLHHRLYFL